MQFLSHFLHAFTFTKKIHLDILWNHFLEFKKLSVRCWNSVPKFLSFFFFNFKLSFQINLFLIGK